MKFDDDRVTSFDPKNIPEECFGGAESRTVGAGARTVEHERMNNALVIVYDRVRGDRPAAAAAAAAVAAAAATATATATVSGGAVAGIAAAEEKEVEQHNDDDDDEDEDEEEDEEEDEDEEQSTDPALHSDAAEVIAALVRRDLCAREVWDVNDSYVRSLFLSEPSFSVFLRSVLEAQARKDVGAGDGETKALALSSVIGGPKGGGEGGGGGGGVALMLRVSTAFLMGLLLDGGGGGGGGGSTSGLSLSGGGSSRLGAMGYTLGASSSFDAAVNAGQRGSSSFLSAAAAAGRQNMVGTGGMVSSPSSAAAAAAAATTNGGGGGGGGPDMSVEGWCESLLRLYTRSPGASRWLLCRLADKFIPGASAMPFVVRGFGAAADDGDGSGGGR